MTEAIIKTEVGQTEAIEKTASFFKPHAHFPSIGPETVFHIGDWAVANSTLILVLSLVIISITLFIFNKRKKMVPNMFQNILESIYESIEGLMLQQIGRAHV